MNASTLFHRINLHLSYKLQLELMEKFTFQDQLTGLYNRSYLSQENTESLTTAASAIPHLYPLSYSMSIILKFLMIRRAAFSVMSSSPK
ncbi:hypothetical protein P4S72_02395 [Vibrio sp. PP-XX7]